MKNANQSGSVAFIVALVMLLIAVVGVGWFTYTMTNIVSEENNSRDTTNNSSSQQSSDAQRFNCSNQLSLSIPQGWHVASAKNSEGDGIDWAVCVVANKPISELPGDLRALEPSDALISVNVDSLGGQDLSSYVAARFPSEGEGLGGFSKAETSEFTFDNGETGLQVVWESGGTSGVTYFYTYTPEAEPGFAQDEQVASLEVRPGNSELLGLATATVKSLQAQ
jgi:hypothetical protein